LVLNPESPARHLRRPIINLNQSHHTSGRPPCFPGPVTTGIREVAAIIPGMEMGRSE